MDELRTEDFDQQDEASQWIRKVESIRRFTKENRRAPYKSLLLLWLVGKLTEQPKQIGQPTRFWFSEVEDELTRLMEKHRMGKTQVQVKYPFVYLGTNHDLWLVKDAEDNNVALMKQSDRESRKFLIDNKVCGGPARAFEEALQNEHVRSEVVNALLHMEFPDTRHDEILADVDLRGKVTVQRSRRDPRFAIMVMKAYEYRCSFCGFSARLEEAPVGVDAAHVQMVAHGGPDSIDNGLALCALHHRLFDRGALGLDQDRRILVSKHLRTNDNEALFPILQLVGAKLRSPLNEYASPARSHLSWHRENLFAEPAR